MPFAVLSSVQKNIVSATGAPPPALFVSASGGTETTSGSFRIHTFNSSATLTVFVGGDVEILAVGGGGGAGGNTGGGGGAGQLIYSASFTLPVTASTVTIGAGGAGTQAQSNVGTPGGNGNNTTYLT